MTSPFRKLGVCYIAMTPALAGISMFEFRVAGMNYTGFVWVAQLLAGLLLLAMILLTSRNQLNLAVWTPWFAWLGYVWMSLVWCHELDGKNVQDAMQYTMPVIVGIIAATVIRTPGELKLVFAGFVFALAGVSFYTFLFVNEIFDYTWLETHVRSAALTTTVMGLRISGRLSGALGTATGRLGCLPGNHHAHEQPHGNPGPAGGFRPASALSSAVLEVSRHRRLCRHRTGAVLHPYLSSTLFCRRQRQHQRRGKWQGRRSRAARRLATGLGSRRADSAPRQGRRLHPRLRRHNLGRHQPDSQRLPPLVLRSGHRRSHRVFSS